ncbi:MAG: acetyltransferase [Parvularculaceae bacterium]|nr:acetyltransferase [Parvularculaceae bacterium]
MPIDAPRIALRPAVPDDAPWFELWDKDPDVVAATTDADDAEAAFGGLDWRAELADQSDVSRYWIALESGRPVGAMQIIDPHREPTQYWGASAPNLRAIDIWIGAPADRGRGLGAAMMRRAQALCFADPAVTAIVIDPLASSRRAHVFYQRLGFAPVERRLFNDGEDDCLVHRLDRAVWAARFPKDI